MANYVMTAWVKKVISGNNIEQEIADLKSDFDTVEGISIKEE